jgi:hypothetical protein
MLFYLKIGGFPQKKGNHYVATIFFCVFLQVFKKVSTIRMKKVKKLGRTNPIHTILNILN